MMPAAPPEVLGPLAPLDRVALVAERRKRPLDFGVVMALRDEAGVLTEERLRRGARSARLTYPVTGARVDRGRWVVAAADEAGLLRAVDLHRAGQRQRCCERFMSERLDPRAGPPLRQLLIRDRVAAKSWLVSRCHHAAGDLLSVLLWLGHQLAVATGRLQPQAERRPHTPVAVRSHPSPVRKTPFAPGWPSQALWRARAEPLRARRWLRLDVDASALRRSPDVAAGSYTRNDVLVAAAALTAAAWNRDHGVPDAGIGVWLPVDVRIKRFTGFGNGASRIRVYLPEAATGGAEVAGAEVCRAVRGQVRWARDHGEWAVGEHPLLRLPEPLLEPVLGAYLRRPWVDVGSLALSHVERPSAAADEGLFGDAPVEDVEVVGALHHRHPLSLAGVTLGGTTQLTLTWDPGLIDDADACSFAARYTARVAELGRAGARCAA